MKKRRDTKKIPTYKVLDYVENVHTEMDLKKIERSMNGIEKHPKNRIKEIINFSVKIKFKTGKQKEFHKLLMDKEVVACQGSAGSGKTFLSVYSAIRLLLEDNNIFRIVLTKPCQQLKDENMGFVKGGVDEKLAPIMESFDDVFEELLGKQAFKTLVEEGIIIHKPLAFVRGKTFKNSVILFDEVQMSTLHVCRSLMQRFGEDSRLFLLGDEAQVERGNRRFNPLTMIYSKFEKYNNPKFGTFTFGLDDIVRNPLIQTFELMFEEIESEVSSCNQHKRNKPTDEELAIITNESTIRMTIGNKIL